MGGCDKTTRTTIGWRGRNGSDKIGHQWQDFEYHWTFQKQVETIDLLHLKYTYTYLYEYI